jgi:hypothetical protein
MTEGNVDIEGIIIDPNNNYPERGVMKKADNGVKHVFFGSTRATPEAVAVMKEGFQGSADKNGYQLIRAVTKK